MNQAQIQTLNQAIKLLQSLKVGGKSTNTSNSLQAISIPQYDNQIIKFYEKGKTLQTDIQKLTQLFKNASQTMKQIMTYSQICKKYSSSQQQKLKQIFINLSNQVDVINKKNIELVDHCKALKQILSATFWVFVSAPEFIVKGAIQGADFNALKFQKKKNQEHNQWWALVSNACKNLQKYVVKNYATGLNFQFNGQDKWDQIISRTSLNSSTSNNQMTENKTQKVEPAKINAPVAKAPKKQLIGLNWQIRNYEGQNLTFTNQIQMKHGIFIENTNNSHIKIESKFKSLNINKCNDITLFVKSCVSGIQIMNCKNMTIIIKQKTPSISVDKCERVKIILNQNNLQTDIVSCKASELNVSYESNEGDQSKAYLISDQLITKWNPQTKKFQTKIYDKFL